MKHVTTISRAPRPAQNTGVGPIETIVLTLFGVFFTNWFNTPQVLRNLQKYFSKTPAI